MSHGRRGDQGVLIQVYLVGPIERYDKIYSNTMKSDFMYNFTCLMKENISEIHISVHIF